jgi:hypothetical protein
MNRFNQIDIFIHYLLLLLTEFKLSSHSLQMIIFIPTLIECFIDLHKLFYLNIDICCLKCIVTKL